MNRPTHRELVTQNLCINGTHSQDEKPEFSKSLFSYININLLVNKDHIVYKMHYQPYIRVCRIIKSSLNNKFLTSYVLFCINQSKVF